MVDQARVLNTDGLPVSLVSQFSKVLKRGPESFPTQFMHPTYVTRRNLYPGCTDQNMDWQLPMWVFRAEFIFSVQP
jgi:hypothetical protein